MNHKKIICKSANYHIYSVCRYICTEMFLIYKQAHVLLLSRKLMCVCVCVRACVCRCVSVCIH